MTAAATAEQVPLLKLVQAEWNANRVPAATLAKVRRSIEEFGLVENLVARPHPTLRGRFEVLSGNHRLELLQEMGFEEAPVVVVELGDADARILAQTLNRTRGQDDPEAYAALLEVVLAGVGAGRATEFLLETETSIERVLRNFSVPAADPDEVPDPPAKAKSKLGGVYELGPHRLVCGDASDPAVLALALGGGVADLLLTDPPYGVSYQGGAQGMSASLGRRRIRTVEGDRSAELYEAVLPLLHPLLRDDGAAYVWFSDSRSAEVLAAVAAAGFTVRSTLIWAKDVPTGALIAHYIPRHEPLLYLSAGRKAPRWFGPTNESTVWDYPKPRVNDLHPTQKPVALIERAIRNSSRVGEVVFDPFAGSGTTMIAAEASGRFARLVEIDPALCDVIRRRYAVFIGDPGLAP